MDGNDHRPEDDQIVQNALMESQDKLYALIRMLMIRNAQDALDVLQNTNAAILEHFEQYDPSTGMAVVPHGGAEPGEDVFPWQGPFADDV